MKKNGKKHIVCLGGGNAMPKAVLAGLKKYPVRISVICAMLDSGGSAGRLRKDYKIVSPGDIRRAFLALAKTSPAIENLFNYRFEAGDLKGHNFANLFITALELTTNDYEKTFQAVKKILNVQHEVLPVTLDNSTLCAVLENGKTVCGETNIDVPKHSGKLKIKKVFLRPKARIYSRTARAIKDAGLIVIGPGDVYSSLAQILLTDGVPQSIGKSKAKKVFVCNLMTKYGETNDFTVRDFADEIENYLGTNLDCVIYNTKIPSPKRLKTFRKKHPELLNLVKFDNDLIKNEKFLGRDILTKSGDIIHDPQKLTKVIIGLCRR